ncbi:MAG: sulfatase, partial [Kiritimatiellia bacterium]
VREVESERNLANIHGSFYEIPRSGYKAIPDWERMRPVASHRKQIHDFCTWQGLLVLSGVDSQAQADRHVFQGDGAAIWCGGVDDLWQLGKPTGQGGPWKNTVVIAGASSDPYLLTGYDQKTLTLHVDKDVTVTVEVNVDHQSGWHIYKTFTLKAGQTETYRFPEAYSAHWIRFTADTACTATAWLVYE